MGSSQPPADRATVSATRAATTLHDVAGGSIERIEVQQQVVVHKLRSSSIRAAGLAGRPHTLKLFRWGDEFSERGGEGLVALTGGVLVTQGSS